MKTPWSNLLEYGTAFTATIVIMFAVLGLLVVVGAGVLFSKMLDYIS